jgi:hypothetical protein
MIKNRAFLFVIGIILSAMVIEVGVRVISPLLGPPLVSWNTMEDAKKLKFEEFLKRYQNPEFVFMGNSTTLIGVRPNIFDESADLPVGSSFNAGMNGSDVKTMRDFAIGYVIKNVRPRNLVMLFSNTKMIEDRGYQEDRVYQKLKIDPPSLISNSYFYKYRNTFKDPMTVNTLFRIAKYRDARQGIVYRWADNLDDFGYTRYEITTTRFPEAGWDPVTENENDERSYLVDDSQFRYLVEVRDFARNNGVNLVIGTVPLPAQDDQYRITIREIANRLGIDFIQGNNAVGRGKYFQDKVHLNKDGSRIFSEYLGQKLPKIVSTQMKMG